MSWHTQNAAPDEEDSNPDPVPEHFLLPLSCFIHRQQLSVQECSIWRVSIYRHCRYCLKKKKKNLNICSRTQRAAVASRCATNLATHFPYTNISTNFQNFFYKVNNTIFLASHFSVYRYLVARISLFFLPSLFWRENNDIYKKCVLVDFKTRKSPTKKHQQRRLCRETTQQ